MAGKILACLHICGLNQQLPFCNRDGLDRMKISRFAVQSTPGGTSSLWQEGYPLTWAPRYTGIQVWKYEGCRTLSYYLKRRDCLQALARDLAVPEKAVVATVMKQIFECLTVSVPLGSAMSQDTACAALALVLSCCI